MYLNLRNKWVLDLTELLNNAKGGLQIFMILDIFFLNEQSSKKSDFFGAL
jgi:hypothetical protein